MTPMETVAGLLFARTTLTSGYCRDTAGDPQCLSHNLFSVLRGSVCLWIGSRTLLFATICDRSKRNEKATAYYLVF